MEDLQDKIAEAQRQVATTHKEMGETVQAFIAAATEYMKDWYWKQAETVVTANFARTQSLEPTQLTALKSDIHTLQDNAGAILQEELGKDDLWWHRKPGKQTYYRSGETRGPDHIDKALRLAAGRLGILLARYGYLNPGTRTHVDWSDASTGRLMYPHMLDLSKDMLDHIDGYLRLQQRAGSEQTQLESLLRKKAEGEAKSLWDKA